MELLTQETFSGDELRSIQAEALQAIEQLSRIQAQIDSGLWLKTKFGHELHETVLSASSALRKVELLTKAIIPF